MKKVKVTIPFQDLEESIARKPGDTFLCKEERAVYLHSLHIVEILGDAEEPEKKKEPKKKAPTEKRGK